MEERKRKAAGVAGGLAFIFVLLVLVFDFADQGLLGPLVNPLLQDFFRKTTNIVPLGWITFVFTLLSAVSTIIAGITADRRSRVRVCVAGGLIYGAFSTLAVLTPHGQAGYVFFFITRALNGIGIGLVVPAVFSLVGDMVDPRRRATAFGFLSVAMLVGRMGGFVLAGSVGGGWRSAYGLVGLINLVLALALLLVREPQRGAREEELRDLILAGAEYRFRISWKDVKLIRSARSNFWLIANFIDVFPGSIVLFLIFKYMKDIHNMDAATVNVAILIVFLAGAFGALVFGRLGDWGYRKDRRAKVLVALFCNAFPIVFMIFFIGSKVWIPAGATVSQALAVPGTWPLILTIAAAMFINQGVNPNWYGALADINLPEHRATMISLASVMDMIGNALGPLLASYVATLWGLRAAMGTVLAFWAVNVLFWLPVLVRIRADVDRVHGVLSDRAADMRRRMSERAD
ncbi:MAG: MFS transporter [Candidatus Aminicenantes bacterium]|nr:MFS transporter [Candidatus Aminicenantes bacterium]